MNTSLEYIGAGIIMCLILGITGRYTTNMVYDNVNLIERNQGIEKAGKLIDLILLAEGKPTDWDESLDHPEMLGFASSNSIKMYVLDKDKVMRLLPTSLGYISPARVRELMGLRAGYYVSIKVFPLFNLTLTKTSPEGFDAQFFNQWGAPVSNINVTAAYINNRQAIDLSKEELDSFLDLDLEAIYDTKITNSLGISHLIFTDASDEGCILVYAKQLTSSCLYVFDVNGSEVSSASSSHVIYMVSSSMGSVSGYNTEVVRRNVKIDGLDYLVRFTLWS